MKKFLALIMALAMVFALAACGQTEGNESVESAEEVIVISSEESTTNTSSSTPVTNTSSQTQTPAACTHKNVETTPAVAATCDAEGKTEGKKCKDCGAVIVAPTSTPKEDHIWIAATTEKPKHCKLCNVTEGTVAAPKAPKATISNPTKTFNGATITFTISKVQFVENNTKCNIIYTVNIQNGATPYAYSWKVNVGTGDTGAKLATDIPALTPTIDANATYDGTFETGPVVLQNDDYGYLLTFVF